MKKKHPRHAIRLLIFLGGLAFILLCHTAIQPQITNITYQFLEDDEVYEASLPMIVEGAPAKEFTVRMNVHVPTIHPILFHFVPDDCIDELRVNGEAIKRREIPFCNFKLGKNIHLLGILNTGDNRIVLSMRNLAWPGGLDLYVSPYDPTNIFLIVVFGALLYWYVSAYMWKSISIKNIRGFTASFSNKEKQQCAYFFKIVFTIIVSIGLLKGFLALTERIAYELSSPYTADMSIYLGMGRGILNGLTPYIDLFENKPPGMFLMSALSIWMFDGPLLLHLIQVLVLIGFPILFFAWFIRQNSIKDMKDLKNTNLQFILVSTLLFSVAIALYTALRSGEAQVESYGAFFGFLYVLVIAQNRRILSRWHIVLAGVFLLISTGYKEPFLLTALAASLVITKGRWKPFCQRFVLPFGIAVITGAIIMYLLGYIWPYLSIYVFGEMFGHHIPEGGSVLSRGFEWEILWYDIKDFSPWFAYSIALMYGNYIFHRFKEGKTFLFYIGQVYLILGVIYLLNLSVGMGGAYYNHHFIFGVPFYIAIFFAFMRDVQENWKVWHTRIIASVVVLFFALTMFEHARMDYAHLLRIFRTESRVAMELAEAVDDVLDHCDMDRYMFLGGNGPQPYAYTKHSPIGPLFFQYYYSLSPDRTFFRESFLKAIHEADLIIVYTYELNDMHKEVTEYLNENFTNEPWKCAEQDMKGVGVGSYRVLFRGGT